MEVPDPHDFCESIDTSLPAVPPRSRLNSLEPAGAGTAFVEAQTSYTARLAESHGVTVAALFGWEVGPHVDSAYLRRRLSCRNKCMVLASTFSSMSRALNGTGDTARNWIAAVQMLTGRDDLEQTTLLAWSDVLSHRGLIRKSKAWCPACYAGWRSESRIVYEPLMWSIQAVYSCAAHRRRLRERCQHCGRPLKHLASHSRPGHCSSCGRWLGVATGENLPGDEAIGGAEYEWQQWVSAAVGGMLAAAPHLASKPSKEVIAPSAMTCVERGTARGSILALSRTYDLPRQTVANWCRGERAPQLEFLLRLCFAVGVSPLNFLTGNLERLTEGREVQPLVGGADEEPRPPRRREKIDLDEVRRALEAALEETPPPSMIGVARRLGRTTGGLKYRFADLCEAIVTRYETYRRQMRRKDWGKARRALNSALRDESHPSVAEVARRIGWYFVRLRRRFPDLCMEVSREHAAYLKSVWSRVGRALEEILLEQPPPSMNEVTRRLDRCATSLYSHFPRLCRRIGARHVEYRRKSFAQRKKEFLAELRRVALSLYNEGVYPSVKKVEERLTVTKSLRSDRAVLETLREVRRELKLDPRAVNPTSF